MSLRRATLPHGRPNPLMSLGEGEGPVAAAELVALAGEAFELPCEDPWLRGSGTPGHAYLAGAAQGWAELPELMDFLDLGSPLYDLKRAERDLYLHAWRPWLDARRVLDVGCGIGRFTTGFLDRGATVWGVDGDLESLRRCAWHAAGRPGALDLHWSSVHRLPDVGDLDAIVAAEVLCYVPDVEPVLAALRDRLRPGGVLLLSWEARWGWAASEDAPDGASAAALSTAAEAVVDQDTRWVRYLDEPALRALLDGAGLCVERCEPTHFFVDGPLEALLPADLTLERHLVMEAAARRHPVWSRLHRIWTVVATRG